MRKGFTLVEITIILIIIGFIAGGVLIGGDLRYTAELRRQVSQLEQFEIATHAFSTKYTCLPGDCAQAEQIGLGDTGGPGASGNGDGTIFDTDGSAGTVIVSVEGLNFWYHLGQAKMAGDSFGGYYSGMSLFDTYPGRGTPPLVLPGKSLAGLGAWSNKTGGIALLHLEAMSSDPVYGGFFVFDGLFENLNRHFWYLTVTTEVSSAPGVWLPRDAHSVDVKIDDGLPRGGRMRSISGRLGTNGWDPSGTACVDKSATPYQYNIQQTVISAATYGNVLCAPLIEISF